MLKVKKLNFRYDDEVLILNDVSFSVAINERTCILGESGSGKSTLLKLIYGTLDPESGEIIFNNDKIRGPRYQLIPGHDDMKYVAQDFDLSPYMTVAENVGKHLSNIYMTKKKERVKEILEVLYLSEFAHKKPVELSGGQMQRVAIARTLAKMPKMLVLDEPFSHLDASLHIKIRQRLMEYCEEKNMGVIFSSHRADDALGYADNLLILKKGEIIQEGSPKDVYLNPKNIYVAELFGKVNNIPSGKANEFNISLENKKKGNLLIYPHEIKTSDNGLKAKVLHCRFIGNGYELDVKYNDIFLVFYHDSYLEKGEEISFKIEKYRLAEK
ncbi:ABC transporter ATP-binding protein [Weeksellaceae bacterium TAE3-ERU29]|nr:ABC transporter ATP-binding protein [Weeksellaceae bacterium TAE3-ERU29]